MSGGLCGSTLFALTSVLDSNTSSSILESASARLECERARQILPLFDFFDQHAPARGGLFFANFHQVEIQQQ